MLGLGLLGIEGTVVANAREAAAALDRALVAPGVAMVLARPGVGGGTARAHRGGRRRHRRPAGGRGPRPGRGHGRRPPHRTRGARARHAPGGLRRWRNCAATSTSWWPWSIAARSGGRSRPRRPRTPKRRASRAKARRASRRRAPPPAKSAPRARRKSVAGSSRAPTSTRRRARLEAREARLERVWSAAQAELEALASGPDGDAARAALCREAARRLGGDAVVVTLDREAHARLTAADVAAWADPDGPALAPRPRTARGRARRPRARRSRLGGRHLRRATGAGARGAARRGRRAARRRGDRGPRHGGAMSVVGRIERIAGPIAHVRTHAPVAVLEHVWVGTLRLAAEVISVAGDRATVQIYEETTGVRPGEPVEGTGHPLSVLLAPGLIGQTFDGIQRPLEVVREAQGIYLRRGASEGLPDRAWAFTPRVAVGDAVTAGAVLGTVPETPLIEHRVLVPPHRGRDDRGAWRREGPLRYADVVARVRDVDGAETRRHARAALAGPPSAPHRGAPGARPSARHRAAGARHLLPRSSRGERRAPRAVRRRQDGAAALAGQVVGRAGDRLRRLRRARQRDGPGAAGVPRARRPAQRAPADGAHDPRRQHLEHAGRRARGERLHRHHAGRVLPRPGLPRRPDGRLHLALGRGAARDRRPPRGDARRGGLPGLPPVAARRLLRARLPRDDALGRRGIGHRDRRGQPARRRLHRAGDPAHAALHARLLGARPRARQRPPLPGGELARELQLLRRRRRGVVARGHRDRLDGPAPTRQRRARTGRPPRTDGAPGGRRGAPRPAALDARDGDPDQGGGAAPERAAPGRRLLPAREAGTAAAPVRRPPRPRRRADRGGRAAAAAARSARPPRPDAPQGDRPQRRPGPARRGRRRPGARPGRPAARSRGGTRARPAQRRSRGPSSRASGAEREVRS